MTARLVFAAALALVAVPAAAVGLGPLRASGVTASERKGFYLTLTNPYPAAARFHLSAIGWDDEQPQPRVIIPVADPTLGAGAQRKLLVIARDLQPGEVVNFRVCAERTGSNNEELIHARVCAKLTARRVG